MFYFDDDICFVDFFIKSFKKRDFITNKSIFYFSKFFNQLLFSDAFVCGFYVGRMGLLLAIRPTPQLGDEDVGADR